MAGKRFVGLAGSLAALLLTGCSQTEGSLSGRLQQAAIGEPPESLTDCAKSAVRRPPVIAAVAGGVQGVAVAAGARMAVCAVRVTRDEEGE